MRERGDSLNNDSVKKLREEFFKKMWEREKRKDSFNRGAMSRGWKNALKIWEREREDSFNREAMSKSPEKNGLKRSEKRGQFQQRPVSRSWEKNGFQTCEDRERTVSTERQCQKPERRIP